MPPSSNRILALTGCVVVLLCSAAGCGNGSVADGAPEFEPSFEGSPLPDGWEMLIREGEYKVAAVEYAHSGQSALAVAGSGGIADLLGPEVALGPDDAYQCGVWLDTEAFVQGKAELGCLTNSGSSADEIHSLRRRHGGDEGWLEYTSVFVPPENVAETSVRMAVRLSGEGLLRVDDVQMKKVRLFRERCLREGFESTSTINESFEISQQAEAVAIDRTTKLPASGGAAISITGRNGYCTLISKHRVPRNGHKVLVEAMIRVKSGVGHLKLEYFQGDHYIDGVRTEMKKTDAWLHVSTWSVADFADDADTIRFSLAAVNDGKSGPFEVDFDDVRLVVIEE